MATARPFAYNPSQTIIPGVSLFGYLSVGDIGTGKITGLTTWNGPNEDLGYVIGYPDTSGLRKVRGVTVSNAVGFMRTSVKTDADFLSLANFLTRQGFMTASVAANWLNTNGYYTSYSTIKCINFWRIPGGLIQKLIHWTKN
jgi:hypothetical protein